ncbi:PAS domain S-box protein, partial [Wenyingzhuangia sp. 1_MG-2023]|nr:PAS domain S-box protein [Wenyingzhuangia sp. 1_MG-2023]
GILIVDGNGLILMTNPALDELFGYHKGELLGQPMEILAPDNEMLFYPDPSTADIGQSGRRTMAKNKHIHGKHRDGHLIDVEISLSPVESDDGIRVSATVVDITDRLEKEKRLRHYASAFREAGEAMVITDAHWKVEHVNSMFTRLCGLSEEKVTGATPDIFLLERMEPGGLSLQQYVEDADHWGGEWQALT